MSTTNAVVDAYMLKFRNDDERESKVLVVEINDMRKDGILEISYKDGKDEVFLQLPLPELIAQMMILRGTE